MFNILLWQSSRRVLMGIFMLVIAVFALPEQLTLRLWVGLSFGLLCPLLVLGRRRALNREIYAVILGSLPRQRRWQLWGLSPALFIVFLWSLIITQGVWELTLIYFAWGMCCVSIADLFDKRSGRLAEAWSGSIIAIFSLGATPFWGALLFGRTFLSPWIATGCISAHPVYTSLKACGHLSLQDPLLYEITQSGLVEIYQLPWWSGALALSMISWLCWELTARSQLRESL